jgi:DNA recombination protein RmuC
MSDLLPLVVGLVLGIVAGAATVLAVVRAGRHDPAPSLAAERAAVDALVRPVSETLQRVSADLVRSERDRASAHAELREQIRLTSQGTGELRDQTGRLAAALRRSDVRGQWGEMQLRRIVEAAGMLPHVHFDEQHTTRDDAGAVLRADMVVHLADGRDVVVDSKVPLVSYLEAVEAGDDATARRLLVKHAADLAVHIDTLGSKEYWRRYDSLELVVLFLPAESLLSAALDVRPDLLEYAFSRDVVLATPTTLLALLRAVSHTWRQESAARNVQEVHSLARELHARIAVLGSHLSKLASSLDAAVGAYNSTVGSLESRVLVSARRLAELGVVEQTEDADSGLPTPRLVTSATRPLAATELVASAEGALTVLHGSGGIDSPHPSAVEGGGDVPYGWTP